MSSGAETIYCLVLSRKDWSNFSPGQLVITQEINAVWNQRMLGGGIAVFGGEVRGYLVKFLSSIGIFPYK